MGVMVLDLMVHRFLLVIQFFCTSLANAECLGGILVFKMTWNLVVLCNLYLYYLYRNVGCICGPISSPDHICSSQSRDESNPNSAEKDHSLYYKHGLLCGVIQKRANMKVKFILNL